MEQLIGKAAETLGLTQDTLRYYEKIGLVPRASKNRGGRRTYSDYDLARLKFVQRAQGVGFSLEEIKKLVKLRENPKGASKSIRAMAELKVAEIAEKRATLERMQKELAELVAACDGQDPCCILAGLDRLPHIDS